MSLSALPQPIKAFLQATASRDRAALLASFSVDAVLIDMGGEHRRDEIARWTESLYLGSNVRVHPLHTEERDGHTVLTVAGLRSAQGDRALPARLAHRSRRRSHRAAAHGGRETGPAGARPWLRACYQQVRSRRHGLALRAGRDRKRSDAPLRGACRRSGPSSPRKLPATR